MSGWALPHISLLLDVIRSTLAIEVVAEVMFVI